jgi:hypothetical protein
MLFEMLRQASVVALLSLIVAVLPLGAGIAYAIGPSEGRLALMRPISLASIFGGLCGALTGAINILRYMAVSEVPIEGRLIALGAAEAIVPLFVAFGSLTVAWLCVAVGLRRHA